MSVVDELTSLLDDSIATITRRGRIMQDTIDVLQCLASEYGWDTSAGFRASRLIDAIRNELKGEPGDEQ